MPKKVKILPYPFTWNSPVGKWSVVVASGKTLSIFAHDLNFSCRLGLLDKRLLYRLLVTAGINCIGSCRGGNAS